MVESPASSNTALQTIKKLVTPKQQTSDECDAAEMQYKRLLREKRNTLEKFNRNVQRLDEFYHDFLNGKPEYNAMYKLIQFLLILSQGYAAVERSFLS